MFFFSNKQRIERLKDRLRKKYDNELDTLRCRIDMPDHLLDDYLRDRKTADYQAVFSKAEPLITVCIATYNRGQLLTERTIPSVLQQTYRNLEVIVVGDCCQDDTAERIARIEDPRLRFVNLPERGNYPDDPNLRWMVAGSTPMNHALSLAQGDFITHLDDDDRYPLDRLEKLLAYARLQQAEFVWHPFHHEKAEGRWELNPAEEFASSQVTTSSVFYHRWFARIGWDINAYRLKEPGDWNRFRKFRYLGVRHARYPEPMLFHYREQNRRPENI